MSAPGLEPTTFSSIVRHLSSRPPLELRAEDEGLVETGTASAQQPKANTAKVTNSRNSQVGLSGWTVV